MKYLGSCKVLILCETSGVTRRSFFELGYDVVSVDLLPADDCGVLGLHIVTDAIRYISRCRTGDYDLVIGHPPCTYLANSGVRWLYETDVNGSITARAKERWKLLREGAKFFSYMWLESIRVAPHVAIENPVMHKHAKALINLETNGFLDKPDFTLQPYQFGDNYTKRTCYWTGGTLPSLTPTSDLDGTTATPECHLMTPGKDRWKKRSVTYPGIAIAMADQWGAYVSERQTNTLVLKQD